MSTKENSYSTAFREGNCIFGTLFLFIFPFLCKIKAGMLGCLIHIYSLVRTFSAKLKLKSMSHPCNIINAFYLHLFDFTGAFFFTSIQKKYRNNHSSISKGNPIHSFVSISNDFHLFLQS